MSETIDVVERGMRDYPSLPEMLPEGRRRSASGEVALADGCYFVAYGLEGIDPFFVGTLRIDTRSGELAASGDLYTFSFSGETEPPLVGQVSPPGPGIPIFPIADYSYYLRVTQIEMTASGFTLSFEASRYIAAVIHGLDGNDSSRWWPQGVFTAQMTAAETAPPGHPRPELFFVGTVANEESNTIGAIQIGFVSPLLRRATIEMDSVPESEPPLDNGDGVSWETIFNGFGWEAKIIVSDHDIAKKDGPVWSGEEARAAMVAHRDNADLDAEWRYHMLVGQLIIFMNAEQRGAMYDLARREGVFLSSHYVFAADQPRWGPLRGQHAYTSAATFFRTAVHETGHAMGLGHNRAGVNIMRPTDGIADAASGDLPFPKNIAWSFAPDDEHRLRHWPDVIVRPGGAALDVGLAAPLAGA